VRNDLDRLAAVPHHVALDNVQALATTVNEDARIPAADGRVVDDIVADDVVVRADLDLDPVVAAVARAAQVVDVVPLEQAVGGPARIVVAARVEAFALRRARCAEASVVDVIAAEDEEVRVAIVEGDRVVTRLIDLGVLERDVVAADEPHPGAPALECQTPYDQVRGVHD